MTTHNRTDPEPVYDDQDYSNLRQVQLGFNIVKLSVIPDYVQESQHYRYIMNLRFRHTLGMTNIFLLLNLTILNWD